MQEPTAAYLDNGTRLHLQQGPIDLIIGADGNAPDARICAFKAAAVRFRTVLSELVEELPRLRDELAPHSIMPSGPVARRMFRASLPFSNAHFATPMIAVAGSVADEILDAMLAATPLSRAYVNNGGDIAVHLDSHSTYSAAIADPDGMRLGTLRFGAGSQIRGIATSGAKGRSFSLGIADSVTTVARDAARADVAATLIANAVDLPDHPGVAREAANSLQPDSDLGARPVVTHVPPLGKDECIAALERGCALATTMIQSKHILGAALFLQGKSAIARHPFTETGELLECANA